MLKRLLTITVFIFHSSSSSYLTKVSNSNVNTITKSLMMQYKKVKISKTKKILTKDIFTKKYEELMSFYLSHEIFNNIIRDLIFPFIPNGQIIEVYCVLDIEEAQDHYICNITIIINCDKEIHDILKKKIDDLILITISSVFKLQEICWRTNLNITKLKSALKVKNFNRRPY